MKRYVKEFAKDVEAGFKRGKDTPEKEKRLEKIRNILFYCEKGMITGYEAVKALVNMEES